MVLIAIERQLSHTLACNYDRTLYVEEEEELISVFAFELEVQFLRASAKLTTAALPPFRRRNRCFHERWVGASSPGCFSGSVPRSCSSLCALPGFACAQCNFCDEYLTSQSQLLFHFHLCLCLCLCLQTFHPFPIFKPSNSIPKSTHSSTLPFPSSEQSQQLLIQAWISQP
jgi:hypothetical protein